MDPASAAIGAIATLGGGGMQIAANAQQQRLQQKFNAEEAHRARDWATAMSNTSYQRAMADMKAAGLNPMLAYQQGGASTPGGAAATSSQGNAAPDIGGNLGRALQSAFSLKVEQDRQKKDAQLVDQKIQESKQATNESASREGVNWAEVDSKYKEQEWRQKLIEKMPTEIAALESEIKWRGASGKNLEEETKKLRFYNDILDKLRSGTISLLQLLGYPGAGDKTVPAHGSYNPVDIAAELGKKWGQQSHGWLADFKAWAKQKLGLTMTKDEYLKDMKERHQTTKSGSGAPGATSGGANSARAFENALKR